MNSLLDRVDALMRDGLGRVFPAAVLTVARNETTRFRRAYGYLDPDVGARPTQVDTRFDLASLTKLFTATAFVRLVEMGQVGLDQPVVTVIPGLSGRRPIGDTEDPLSLAVVPPPPRYRGQEVEAEAVTFRHLLTHTSGLAAWRSLFRELAGTPLGQRRRRAVELVCGYDFAYPTGQEVVYSDLGFILLGEAVARLTDRPLNRAVQELVLEPLALADTGYCPSTHTRSIAPTEICPWRGRRLRGEVDDKNAAAVGGVSGHAGLFAPAHDVLALGCCFLHGGAPLLRLETVAQMTQEQVSMGGQRRGLVWLLAGDEHAPYTDSLGPEAYGHTGFTGTSLWVAPRHDLVVVLLTNRVYYGRDDGEAVVTFRHQLHRTIAAAIEQE
ncbi:MAG: serine hydrolase domain-containing protein [Anaerolineae bacterium]